MRLIFFALIAISIISTSFSQSESIAVHFGEKKQFEKNSMVSEIIGGDDTGIYLVNREVHGAWGLESFDILEKYDLDFNFQRSLKLGNTEFVIYNDDNIYVFSSEIDNNLNLKTLYFQSIDKKSLSINDDRVIVCETDFSEFSEFNTGAFSYKLSKDRSKILIMNTLPRQERRSLILGFGLRSIIM